MLAKDGNEIEMAGALVTAAEIRLAQRDHAGARAAADEAAGWYRKQGREGWVAVTTSLALQAAAREDDPAIELADQLDEVAGRLDDGGLGAEATRSRLVGALVRAEAADTLSEDPVPADTRRRVRSGPSADRILLAHVDAVAAQKRGDRAAARRAISRGLSVAMSSQASLGSLETRAHAAIHGNALTEIGARIAVSDGRPRELLARIEATRLMAARTPSLRPPADPEIARLLAELRSTEVTFADATLSDAERRVAEATHARLERDIRRRSRSATRRCLGADRRASRDRVGLALLGRPAVAGSRQARRPPVRRFRDRRSGQRCTTSVRSTTSTSGSRR